MDLIVAGRLTKFKNLVIYITPNSPSYCSIAVGAPDGRYLLISQQNITVAVDKKAFKETLHNWFISSIPSYAALYEATGGQGFSYSPKEKSRLEAEHGHTIEDTAPEHAFKQFLKNLDVR